MQLAQTIGEGSLSQTSNFLQSKSTQLDVGLSKTLHAPRFLAKHSQDCWLLSHRWPGAYPHMCACSYVCDGVRAPQPDSLRAESICACLLLSTHSPYTCCHSSACKSKRLASGFFATILSSKSPDEFFRFHIEVLTPATWGSGGA